MSSRVTMVIMDNYVLIPVIMCQTLVSRAFHSLAHLILVKLYEVDVVIMPILQRKKLKNREVNDVIPRKSFGQSK